MTDADLPLDNPMLVQWEFASEERLEKRNALYRRLIEGVNAEDVLFDAVREVSPKRLLDVAAARGRWRSASSSSSAQMSWRSTRRSEWST